MRFSLHRVLRLLLIGTIALCFASGGAAQSIGKWVAPFAEQLFPLFTENDRALLLNSPSKETTITDLLGTTWSIKEVAPQYICIASDSTITEELALLPYQKGQVLCHLRTMKTPAPITLLSFYDKEGTIIPNREFLPPIDGRDFLLPSADRAAHTYRSVEQILLQLPLRYAFSAKELTLQLHPEYTLYATEEQKAVLQKVLRPTPIVLKWKKKGFVQRK